LFQFVNFEIVDGVERILLINLLVDGLVMLFNFDVDGGDVALGLAQFVLDGREALFGLRYLLVEVVYIRDVGAHFLQVVQFLKYLVFLLFFERLSFKLLIPAVD